MGDRVGQLLTEDAVAGPLLLGTPLWMNGTALRARQQVWVAVGQLTHQHGSRTATDALATLRAYAFRHDWDLETAAQAILRGELPPA